MVEQFYIGIDVGTGSARAGIFNQTGRLISQSSHEIQLWKPKTDFVEQSSENIWEANCHSVKQAMAESNLEPEQIGGIGFDATCSPSSTIDDLSILYLATIQAFAYGTRHIIETMNKVGYEIQQIAATGGGTKNDLFLKKCTMMNVRTSL